ncbi:MAG: HD domain-containing protein [Microthrixaceae bacterium]
MLTTDVERQDSDEVSVVGQASAGDGPSAPGWNSRPLTARALRVAIALAPVLVAALCTWSLAGVLGRPRGAGLAIWVIGMFAFGTVVYGVTERAVRHLLPLSALLRLSFALPEGTPSRFRIAMRAGSVRELRKVIEAARSGVAPPTAAAAAEQVLMLVAALNVHDHLTRGHSERVRAYSEVIAREMRLDAATVNHLRWAALLHDIGKIAIPVEILNKPGRLTKEEFDLIKTHPTAGLALVAPLEEWLGESLCAVVQHHERMDGTGYPYGLPADSITEVSRIVSVADTFDVITSQRSYKDPVSTREALAEIARCAGTQFDPDVVKALLGVSIGRLWLAGGPLTWVASIPGLANAPSVGGAITAFSNASLTSFATAAVLGTATLAPITRPHSRQRLRRHHGGRSSTGGTAPARAPTPPEETNDDRPGRARRPAPPILTPATDATARHTPEAPGTLRRARPERRRCSPRTREVTVTAVGPNTAGARTGRAGARPPEGTRTGSAREPAEPGAWSTRGPPDSRTRRVRGSTEPGSTRDLTEPGASPRRPRDYAPNPPGPPETRPSPTTGPPEAPGNPQGGPGRPEGPDPAGGGH